MIAYLQQLRRAVRWHRRSLAAAAAALAVLAAVGARVGAGGPEVAVLVAARELRPGVRVGANDVRLEKWPAEFAPDLALRDPARIVGRTLAGAVARGAILTELSPVTERIVGPGRALLPVRMTDSDVRNVVRPGDRVSLIALGVGDSPARVVAEDVVIVAIPIPEGEGALSVSRGAGSLLLVDVDAGAVAAVVQATSSGLALAFE